MVAPGGGLSACLGDAFGVHLVSPGGQGGALPIQGRSRKT